MEDLLDMKSEKAMNYTENLELDLVGGYKCQSGKCTNFYNQLNTAGFLIEQDSNLRWIIPGSRTYWFAGRWTILGDSLKL